METISGPVSCVEARFGWETEPTEPGECPKLTLMVFSEKALMRIKKARLAARLWKNIFSKCYRFHSFCVSRSKGEAFLSSVRIPEPNCAIGTATDKAPTINGCPFGSEG